MIFTNQFFKYLNILSNHMMTFIVLNEYKTLNLPVLNMFDNSKKFFFFY